MKKIIFVIFISFSFSVFSKVVIVDFLKPKGLKYNAAGPLIVKLDKNSKRLVLLNTNTSSISLIDTNSLLVKNIPTKKRIPQFLKDEIIKISDKGNIYFISDRAINFIDVKRKKTTSKNTLKQYESIDFDSMKNIAYAVGRESKYILKFDIKRKKLSYIPWLKNVEQVINLNQTPPPSSRKLIVDSKLRILIGIDVKNKAIYEYSIKRKKVKLKKRIFLNVKDGNRWHLAGVNKKSHKIYMVIETVKRQVLQAFEYDIKNRITKTINFPIYREAAGIKYNPLLNQVYIPYDNNGIVIIADFNRNRAYEVALPGYGNDAISYDNKNKLLFIASWEYGEIEIVDLTKMKFVKSIKELGILPHSFNMEYCEESKRLFIPIGATAVNGSFGSAIITYDFINKKKTKIHTGWSPISIVKRGKRESFLVFNSEDEFAEVFLNGKFNTHKLPHSFSHDAVINKNGNIYLSYGPHQSYWPAVYIWGARNGILTINSEDLSIFDRRIPRLANRIVLDKNGNLYCLQNSWGKEKMFLTKLKNEIRYFEARERIVFKEDIERETTPIDLKYDKATNSLFVLKSGETDNEKGIFIIYDLENKKELKSIKTGKVPTSISFDNSNIFITNFNSDTVTKINKSDFSIQSVQTGKQPLKSTILNRIPYIINHSDNSVSDLKNNYKLPVKGFPDNIVKFKNKIFITTHSESEFNLISFNPDKKDFKIIYRFSYPYGQTRFDTKNSAFFMNGQYGDSIFELNKVLIYNNTILITDYISGKLFIIKDM